MDLFTQLPSLEEYTRIGYARVSTEDQKLGVQIQQLRDAGCRTIYQDKQTGTNAQRPGLKKMLGYIRPGDLIVVCKLDRLARSTMDLLNLITQIDETGGSLYSLSEPWVNTGTPSGKLIVTIFAGVAQFERERMAERCREGRAAAMARGVKFGGKRGLPPGLEDLARETLKSGTRPAEVAAKFGVSRATAYRLKRAL
jgi:DNA invertase Pin-like site-specific DNA recombinase